jgi:hypothetical protein
MSSVAKKKTKASLFSGKERQLGKLEGRGTLRFSITLLTGCTDFDIFFHVPDFDTNDLIYFNDRAALIIDGQFLVQSLKHQGLRTFGEYVDMYVGVVLRKGVRFRRIDVVFDRYRTQSIKSGT